MPIDAFGGEVDSELPVGSVVMWAGTIADIPSGWALCDGNNMTLDFTGRFVKGPADTSSSPGATGGNDSYTLSVAQLPEHDHESETDYSGLHNHDMPYISGGSPTSSSGSVEDQKFFDGNREHDLDSAGWHYHDLFVGDSGSDNAIDNRPRYFEVAFIEKL